MTPPYDETEPLLRCSECGAVTLDGCERHPEATQEDVDVEAEIADALAEDLWESRRE